MEIKQATASYEKWMRGCTKVVKLQLESKHQRMRDDAFSFFRGTYYRWAQLWPVLCRDLTKAPKVQAVGDLHIDSFGTWRDSEGRLCWGVDDFDEAYPLPYTNDLVRLAASVKVAIEVEVLAVKLKDACDAILSGYEDCLRHKGRPMVLAENEQTLELLGRECIRSPNEFWNKLNKRPAVHNGIPREVRNALEETFPAKDLDYKLVRREAGLGSLGQERFVAIAKCEGSNIAREAKSMMPSASVWLKNGEQKIQSFYKCTMDSAVRSRDPYQQIVGRWLIRRLSPDANPIYVADLPKERDEESLLNAMGAEAANVHLGSKRGRAILRDLRRRDRKWLRSAAKAMAKVVKQDWKDYRK